MVCSVSETDDFPGPGFQQAEEPESGEVAVGPAMVILPAAAAPAATTLAQYGAQSHPHPLVDLTQLADMGVFEAGEPAFERPVEVRRNGFHALSAGPAGLEFDGLSQRVWRTKESCRHYHVAPIGWRIGLTIKDSTRSMLGGNSDPLV